MTEDPIDFKNGSFPERKERKLLAPPGFGRGQTGTPSGERRG
jgi:hypothetical protein